MKVVNFITKKNRAKNEFEKGFYELLNIALYGKTMESVRNRMRLERFQKDDSKTRNKQQSKLTLNGIQKSYQNCVSYLFRKNEVVMDKPIFLVVAILQLTKLHMYETYYDKIQPYFGQDKLQLHYIDTDAFVLSVKTKVLIKDFKKLRICL